MMNNRTRLETLATSSVQKSGLKGLSFRTLAEEVGIKSSSVHYHFPEKSDLASALITRYHNAVFAQLSDIDHRDTSLSSKMTDFVGIFEEVAHEDRLCLCGMMAAEVESLSDNNVEQLRRFFTEMEAWLCRLLENHSDEYDASIASPAQFAESILSGLEGALLVDRVVGTSRRLEAQKAMILAMVG